MSIIDLGPMVREILKGIPTIVEGLRKSYESALKIKDKATARRDMARLEQVSEAFSKLVFQPDGIRDLLQKYVASPKSRLVKGQLQSKLNRGQELYQDALKSLNLSAAFKARHPELMAELGTYIREKGRLISGLGDRIAWRGSNEELAELREFDPLFDRVNTGIKKIQKDIKDHLAKVDREIRLKK